MTTCTIPSNKAEFIARFPEVTPQLPITDANLATQKLQRKLASAILNAYLRDLPTEVTVHWLQRMPIQVSLKLSEKFKASSSTGLFRYIADKVTPLINLGSFAKKREVKDLGEDDGRIHSQDLSAWWNPTVFRSWEDMVEQIVETMGRNLHVLPNLTKDSTKAAAEYIAKNFARYQEAQHKAAQAKQANLKGKIGLDELARQEALVFLQDDRGHLPDNVIFAMMAVVDSWMSTAARGAVLLHDSQRSRFFYKDDSVPLTQADLDELQLAINKGTELGALTSSVTEILGRQIYRALKLEDTSLPNELAVSEKLRENLQLALGRYALELAGEVTKEASTTWFGPRFKLTVFDWVFELGGVTVDGRKYNPGDKRSFIYVGDTNQISLKGYTRQQREGIKQAQRADNKSVYDIASTYEVLIGLKNTNSSMIHQRPVTGGINTRSDITKFAPVFQKAIDRLRSQAWSKSNVFSTVMDLLSDEATSTAITRLAGIVPITEDMTRIQESSVTAANRDKWTVFQELIRYDLDGMLDKFYFNYDTMIHGRIMQKGRIAPQSSKTARAILRSWEPREYTQANINWYKLSVVYSMGQLKKNMTAQEVVDSFEAITQDAQVIAVREALEQKDFKKISESLNTLMDSDKYNESDLLTLAAIESLSNYNNYVATGEAFSSDLPVEADGRSNGFAMILMQFPLYKGELTERMNQVGNVLPEQLTNTTFEAFMKTVADPYESVARFFVEKLRTGNAQVKHIVELFPTELDIELESGRVASAVRTLIKQPFIMSMYGAMAKSISTETAVTLLTSLEKRVVTLIRDIHRANAELNNSEVAGLRQRLSVLNQLVNPTQDIQNRIDEITAQLVTAEADQVSQKAIASKNTALMELLPIIEKIGKWDSALSQQITDIATADVLDTAALREFNFTQSNSGLFRGVQTALMDTLKGAIDAFVGKEIGQAREAVVQAGNAIYQIFTMQLQKKLVDFNHKYGFQPAQETILKWAKDDLRQFFPTYTGPLDALNSAISLGAETTSTIAQDAEVFVSEGQRVATMTGSQVTVNPGYLVFSAPELKSIIRAIQNMDATLQASSLLETGPVVTLYDAALGDPLDIQSYASSYNNSFLELNRTHSIAQAMHDSLKRVYDLAKSDMGTATQTPLAGGLLIAESRTANIGYPTVSHVQSLLRTLQLLANHKEGINTQYSELITQQMANVDMGVLTESTEIDPIAQALQDTLLGSLTGLPADNVVPNTSIFGTGTGAVSLRNFRMIFDAFRSRSAEYYGSTDEQTTHEAQLTKMLDIMEPVLGLVNKVRLNIRDIDGVTQGTAEKYANEITVSLSRDNTPHTLLAQTPAEVYTHELSHPLLARAFTDSFALRKRATKYLDQLKQYMEAHGKSAFFLQGIAAPTDADIAHAQLLYNYLLDNPGNTGNELAEFVALGTTNRQFIQALQAFKNRAGSSIGVTLWQRIKDLFGEAMDSVSRVLSGRINSSAYADLIDLSVQLARVQTKQLGVLRRGEAYLMRSVTTDLGSFITRHAKTAHLRVLQANGGNLLIRVPQSLYGLLGAVVSSTPPFHYIREKAVSLISSRAIRSIIHEMGKGTLTISGKLKVLQTRHSISKARQQVEIAYVDHFNSILPNITRKEGIQLTNMILKSDLSAAKIAGYTGAEIKQLLLDPVYRAKQLQIQLDKVLTWRKPEIVKYADELAHFMMTGASTLGIWDGYTNTTQIMAAFDTSATPGEIQALDTYISLKALEHLPKAADTHLLARISPEVLEGILADHTHLKLDTLKELYGSNPYSYPKGYIKKRDDHYVAYKIGLASDAARMRQRGYVRSVSLGNIPGINDAAGGLVGRETFLYVATNLPTPGLKSGIASFTETVNVDRLDFRNLQLDTQTNPEWMKIAKKVQKIIRETASPTTPVTTRPIRGEWVNEAGKIVQGIVGYRAVVADRIMDPLFSPDLHFRDVMAHMKSHFVDQQQSKIVNADFVQYLLGIQQSFYKTDPSGFVNLLEPKYREYFTRLPSYLQSDILKYRDTAGKFMVVETNLDKEFGYIEYTVTNRLENHPFLAKSSSIFERVFTEVVGLFVRRIAYLTLDVLGANVLSNLAQLVIRGIPPTFMLEKIREGYSAYKEYENKFIEMHKLKEEVSRLGLGTTSPQFRATLRITKQLEQNPMHEFFTLGLNSMITEAANAASHSGFIEHRLKQLANSPLGAFLLDSPVVPTKAFQTLGVIGGAIMMNQNNPAAVFMKKLSSTTDLLARYVMVEHAAAQAKKAGTSVALAREEQLAKALDAFIVYDENLNPYVQYWQSIGAFSFATFWLRNQRVALELLKDYPGNVAVAAALQFTTGADTLANINSSIFMGRLLPYSAEYTDIFATALNPVHGLDQLGELASLITD